MRPLNATISITALQHNIAYFEKLNPHKKIAVLKANAYGHGIKHIASHLNQLDGFAVAFLSEALELSRILSDNHKPILILSGATEFTEHKQIAKHGYHTVIHNNQQLEWLKQTKHKPKNIWLKVNIGMNRLGFDVRNTNSIATFKVIISSLQQIGYNKESLNLIAHLSQSEEQTCHYTQQQKNTFKNLLESLQHKFKNFSLANSGEVIFTNTSHAHFYKNIPTHKIWDRIGISLYGISPNYKQNDKLKPVMNLTSTVQSLQTVHKGEAVGYSSNWVASKDNQLIANVDGGYADCYPDNAENRACVLINNQLCPVIGSISMDRFTVDVTNCSDVKVGSQVLIWGNNLSIEKVAASIKCKTYSLTTRLGARVLRKTA